MADLGEGAGGQGTLVDLERGLAAVGGVGEDVVDGEGAAEGDPGGPAFVVPLRGGPLDYEGCRCNLVL